MSYFVYVLKSESYQTRYVGCAEDVSRRIEEHNAGRCRYTKGRRPWRLIHQEEFRTHSEARKREYFLKSGVGRQELDKILSR